MTSANAWKARALSNEAAERLRIEELLWRWLDASHAVFGFTRDRDQLRFDTKQYLATLPSEADALLDAESS